MHFKFHTNYFLLLLKSTEETSRRSMLFNDRAEGVSAISNMMSVQPSTMGVDWREIGRLIEISMFGICP